MAILTNRMDVTAVFNSMTTTAQSTVTLELGNMTLLKTADQDPWLDGPLTYTVTLENIETTGNITSIEFDDIIDITKTQLDTSSVTLNGATLVPVTGFTYDPDTGALHIDYDTALAPGEKVTITFRVTKV